MTKGKNALSKRWKQQAKKKNDSQPQTPTWLIASLATAIVGVIALVIFGLSRTQSLAPSQTLLPTVGVLETVDPSLRLLTPPVTYFATRPISAYTCPEAGCSIAYPVPQGGSVVIDAIQDQIWGRIQGYGTYVKIDALTRTDINQPLPTYPPQAIPANNNAAPQQYNSSGQDLDCANFGSHAAAQSFFLSSGPNDPHQLDGDRDGIACEALLWDR